MRHAVCAAVAALATACVAPQPSENMELYCELKSCVCSEVPQPLFGRPDRTDVVWSGGHASCPEGYALAPANPPEGPNSKYYKKP